MKLQKNTWGLLISALLLGIGVAAYEFSNKIPTTEIKTDNQPLVSFKVEEIQTLIVKDRRMTLEFQRNGDEQQPWTMIKPKQGIANNAVISFLTNLLINSESDRRFAVTKNQFKDYGLDQPFATITIILKDQSKYQLKLGDFDFQNQFIYASLSQDQDQSQPEVLLVSKDFQYAVERELEEWQQAE
ncbi:MAG: DUF4340 domain-containing protein [Microcystaceae cyanobacterium]